MLPCAKRRKTADFSSDDDEDGEEYFEPDSSILTEVITGELYHQFRKLGIGAIEMGDAVKKSLQACDKSLVNEYVSVKPKDEKWKIEIGRAHV